MRKILVLFLGLLFANPAIAQNYTATQGTGTTFGAKSVSSVLYPQIVFCDPTTPSQCVAVNSSGQMTIANTSFAATQSGTWTVQPGNTPNTSPWLFTINQGSNSAVVKAGNTAATTDVALVVADPNLLAAAILPVPLIAGTIPTTQTAVATGATTKAQSDLNGNQYANVISQYPAGATPLTASNTGTTGATTATLAGAASVTTYLCTYSIRANATAAATVTNTVTGVITATLSHIMWVAPAASGLGVDEQIFTPCVPASAVNTGIAVVSGAPGTGGNVSVTATGYQK
jgi:hypothetical protein